MKMNRAFLLSFVSIGFIIFGGLMSCKPGGEGKDSKARKQDSISLVLSNVNGKGTSIEIEMIKGKAHNHPTFAVWIEDMNGIYIQTLFITSAIGQGIFTYGDKSGGKWKPGEVRRPAALPYWAHKRGITSEDGSLMPTPRNKVADAYSGATPAGSFRLTAKTDNPLSGKVKLLLEINQPWDWNEYWTNERFPDDPDYKASCQPAVIYSADIDFGSAGEKIVLKPIGYSHYSGKTGEIFTDLITLTTALDIAKQISATVK